MPPRRPRHVDAYDSNDSFSPNDNNASKNTSSAGKDVFNVNEDKDGSDTKATDAKDLNTKLNVKDLSKLFGRNLQPPKYWQRAVEDMNESEFKCQDYSPSTTALLDNVEEQYCKVLNRNPQQCYKTLSVGILYNFFN
ncbi:hypothetical protein LZ30DRAFT_827490 [Colletotrichum cereale]|nr:hypothetical protein LZ30DRAFT_827490 [Colletotrichum cereale]